MTLLHQGRGDPVHVSSSAGMVNGTAFFTSTRSVRADAETGRNQAAIWAGNMTEIRMRLMKTPFVAHSWLMGHDSRVAAL